MGWSPHVTANTWWEVLPFNDPEMIVAYAAISFKEGNDDEALAGHENVLNTLGFEVDVGYGMIMIWYVNRIFLRHFLGLFFTKMIQ